MKPERHMEETAVILSPMSRASPVILPSVFVAHLDQIEPCKDVKPVVDGHIIRTDGTTTLGGDDKGGCGLHTGNR